MPFVGIGVGIGRQRFGGGIFAAYAARVAADGGVTEAGACVDAVSGISLDASLLLVPSGYKEDVVYSQIPTDGSGDLTFTRASTATRVNSEGLIESVATGVPRLDYSQGSCPSLLLEGQRTNLLTYSEEFDNGSWTKGTGGVSTVNVTANYAISPDGYQNAERIQLTRDSAGFAQVAQTVSTTSGQVYTFSVYLKSLNGTPTIMFGSYGGTNAQTATLTNEWVRYTWTATSPSTSAFPMLMIWGGIASTSLSADFLAYGYQLEQGAYATSYIKTTSATVTRLADDCSKTGISSLIGQTEGTMFIDFEYFATLPITTYFSIDNVAGNNRIIIYGVSTPTIYCLVQVNGVTQATFQFNPNSNTRYKMAIAYKVNDFAFYLNGSQTGVDLSGSVTWTTPLSRFTFNTASNYNGNRIYQAALFTTRLSNAELAELTTL